MKLLIRQFIFLLGVGIASSSIAAQNATDRYSMTLRIGVAENSVSSSELVPPPTSDLDPELFNTTQNQNFFLDYGLEFAYLTPITQAWSLHTGLAYFYGSSQQMDGDYYARPLSPIDQQYTFDLEIQRLLLVSELWYQMNPSWSVFSGINVGMARMHTSALQFTSIPQAGGTSLPLTSSTAQTTGMAYGITLGTSYMLNSKWQVKGGIDYSWLQDISVPYYNGVSNVQVDIGRLAPYEFWFGVAYQF